SSSTVCVSGDGCSAMTGPAGSVDAFDDAEVALDAVGEGHQRPLVCLALVCRDGLFKAVELDQNDALRDSGLVGDDSTATGQGAPAASPDSRTGQVVVRSQRLRVGNGGVDTDPVALSHGNLLCSAGQVRLRHMRRLRLDVRPRERPVRDRLRTTRYQSAGRERGAGYGEPAVFPG